MPELSRLPGRRRALISPFVLASLACGIVPAAAQTSQTAAAPAAMPAMSIEDIQVTAERRSTDIQKTPLAISAISADSLDKSNVNALADTNGLVPGLEITKSSG